MLESKDMQIALFRYGIISDFVNQVKLPYGEQEELIKYKCSHTWNIPNTKRTRIHRSTILSWIKRYKDGGRRIEALFPHEKSDKNKSRVIDHTTANNICWLVKNSEVSTVNQVQQEMNHRKLISSETNLKFQTLYRFLHQNSLMTYLKSRKKYSDKRSDNTEKNRFWLRSLVQGKIRLEELIEDFSPKIPCEDIKLLYDSILN